MFEGLFKKKPIERTLIEPGKTFSTHYDKGDGADGQEHPVSPEDMTQVYLASGTAEAKAILEDQQAPDVDAVPAPSQSGGEVMGVRKSAQDENNWENMRDAQARATDASWKSSRDDQYREAA